MRKIKKLFTYLLVLMACPRELAKATDKADSSEELDELVEVLK